MIGGRFMLLLAGTSLAVGLCATTGRACTIAGRDIQFGAGWDNEGDVLIRPAGRAPFSTRYVHADRVVATVPDRAHGRTTLEVHDVLAFSGTTDPLTYRVSVPLQTAQGMVKLAVGATVAEAVAVNGAVEGSIELRGSAEILRSVRIPCNALTLDIVPRASPEKDPDDHLPGGDGTWWRGRTERHRFTLRARPDERAPAVSLTVDDSGTDPTPLVFERVEARGGWVRLGREGFRTVVIGWAPVAAVEATSRPPAATGCCYSSTSGPGLWGEGRRAKPYAYEGPAHIAKGTTIFADPGAGPWAKVEKNGVFRIRYDQGDTWAQITDIPGVGGPEISAYVAVTATRRDRR